jgi:hypothetical protein
LRFPSSVVSAAPGLTGALAVLVATGGAPSPVTGAQWTFALRGGYGWTVGDREPAENAPSMNVVAARSIFHRLSLVGSAGYLPLPDTRSNVMCVLDSFVDPCPNPTYRADIVPVAVGLRFGGPGREGVYLPALEFAPTVFFGRWVRETPSVQYPGIVSTSMDRVFLGFQASLTVPFRITDRWYADVGFLYLHSEALESRSVFGPMEGIRQMHVLGSVGCRFGAP